MKDWFSAKVRLVVLIEPTGAVAGDEFGLQDSLFVFTAADWQDAFDRALQLGRGLERDYANGADQQVRVRLKAVLSLDIMHDVSLDGAEVHCDPVALGPTESYPFDATFSPERSTPTQTI